MQTELPRCSNPKLNSLTAINCTPASYFDSAGNRIPYNQHSGTTRPDGTGISISEMALEDKKREEEKNIELQKRHDLGVVNKTLVRLPPGGPSLLFKEIPVCPNIQMVQIVWNAYEVYYTEMRHRAILGQNANYVLGPAIPRPNISNYGCIFLPSGQEITKLRIVEGVPVFNFEDNGNLATGVTLPTFIAFVPMILIKGTNQWIEYKQTK